MNYVRKLMPALATAVLVASCSTPGPTDKLLKATPFETVHADLYPSSGYRQARMGPWATASSRCGLRAPARVVVVKRPTNGAVSIQTRDSVWEFHGDNEFRKCNGLPVRAPFAVYRPDPGFTGVDGFTLRIDFVNGERRVLDAQMRVH